MNVHARRHKGTNGHNGRQTLDDQHRFVPTAISPRDAAAVAVRASIRSAHQRLTSFEEAARQGDPEGVHGLRTSSRRLRSTLRAFQSLLDTEWAKSLEGELKWLAEKLGAVRDLDILRGRLAAAAEQSENVLQPLFDSLSARHDAASAALRDALASPRYRALLNRLIEAAEHPALNDDAEEPCRKALPPLVEQDWKRLRKCARLLNADSPDTDFHEVRKRAKRARYAAEAVSVALDAHAAKAAKRFAQRATEVQDVLGEHQDAVIACDELHRAVEAEPTNGPFNFAAGRLIEKQQEAAASSRLRFFDVWAKLDRKKNRRWLKV
jgi:CHAD domain-containing protein